MFRANNLGQIHIQGRSMVKEWDYSRKMQFLMNFGSKMTKDMDTEEEFLILVKSSLANTWMTSFIKESIYKLMGKSMMVNGKTTNSMGKVFIFIFNKFVGVIKYASGQIYKGEFADDKRFGNGVYIL